MRLEIKLDIKATCRTGQCDVTKFLIAIHYHNTIKQYPEIAVICAHCLSVPIMLQITAKYLKFQFTVVECKSILLAKQ